MESAALIRSSMVIRRTRSISERKAASAHPLRRGRWCCDFASGIVSVCSTLRQSTSPDQRSWDTRRPRFGGNHPSIASEAGTQPQGNGVRPATDG